MIAETVLVPNRGKAGTQDGESMPGFFNASRFILEVDAVAADRPGDTYLNRIDNFHLSMCDNRRPVMTENND